MGVYLPMKPLAFRIKLKPTPCGTDGVHQHTAKVDARGNLTYPGVGWAPVAGEWCYKCGVYTWQKR